MHDGRSIDSPGCAHAAPCLHPCCLQLAEITAHINAAVQEEYVASMEFVAAQFVPSPPPLQAYVNCRATPYMPE